MPKLVIDGREIEVRLAEGALQRHRADVVLLARSGPDELGPPQPGERRPRGAGEPERRGGPAGGGGHRGLGAAEADAVKAIAGGEAKAIGGPQMRQIVDLPAPAAKHSPTTTCWSCRVRRPPCRRPCLALVVHVATRPPPGEQTTRRRRRCYCSSARA